jgi:hypothetical protein
MSAAAGARMPGKEISKSVHCATDNPRNRAPAAVPIRSKRTGRKCFSLWKPTLIKPRENSSPPSRVDIRIATTLDIFARFSAA